MIGIRVENIYISVGVFKFENLSFEVSSGEYLILLGPTGSGKSVMLEMLAGIRQAGSGRVFYNNEDMTNVNLRERKFTLVFQNGALFPHMDVLKNISYCAKNTNLLQKIISELKIENLLKRMPGSLSGGETQLVSIARVLATEPRLLLLDEPLSALDYDSRQFLQKYLKHINKTFNLPVVHVTHDLQEANRLCDRVAVLNKNIANISRIIKIYSALEFEELLYVGNSNTKDIKRAHTLFENNIWRNTL